MTSPISDKNISNCYAQITEWEKRFGKTEISLKKGTALNPGLNGMIKIVGTVLKALENTPNDQISRLIKGTKERLLHHDYEGVKQGILAIRKTLLDAFPQLKGDVKQDSTVASVKESAAAEPTVSPIIKDPLLKNTQDQWYQIIKRVYDTHVEGQKSTAQKAISSTVEKVFPYLKIAFKNDDEVLSILAEIKQDISNNKIENAEHHYKELLTHLDSALHPKSEAEAIVKEQDSWGEVEQNDWGEGEDDRTNEQVAIDHIKNDIQALKAMPEDNNYNKSLKEDSLKNLLTYFVDSIADNDNDPAIMLRLAAPIIAYCKTVKDGQDILATMTSMVTDEQLQAVLLEAISR